jgi:hypothetical protein
MQATVAKQVSIVASMSFVGACRCLDISSSRCKLALIDEASTVVVYDLNTKVRQHL